MTWDVVELQQQQQVVMELPLGEAVAIEELQKVLIFEHLGIGHCRKSRNDLLRRSGGGPLSSPLPGDADEFLLLILTKSAQR